MHTIKVTHSIDAGHRVLGHEKPDGSPGKCSRLHGHTYGFDVVIGGSVLDATGFVVDFGLIKGVLDEWDHRLLLWERDPFGIAYPDGDDPGVPSQWAYDDDSGVVRLSFNPTAENMAAYLAHRFVSMFEVDFCRMIVRETAKSEASFTANAADAVTQVMKMPWPDRRNERVES